MSLHSTAVRVNVIILVLMLLLQPASAHTPGYDNERPGAKQQRPAWLTVCDSLNRVLAAPVKYGIDSQQGYATWVGKEGDIGIAEFMRSYFFLDANPVYWFHQSGVTLYQALESITFQVGFETAIGDEFVAEIVGVPPPMTGGSDNTNMNWVLSKTFDENGNVVGENKEFYDNSGRSMQTQSKVNFRQSSNSTVTHVFASQPIRDALGKVAATTMSAPIVSSEFGYKPDFVLNANGTPYDYRNFDRFNATGTETDKTNNPDPVGGQNIPGTLGWYYGRNNTLEFYSATTDFPYSRQSFYRDGTGSIKEIANAGEVFRMGTNRESSTFVTPVYNELTNYIAIRNRFFPAGLIGELPVNMAQRASQLVAKDADGKETIVINDKDGNTLMLARPGTDMQITNTVTLDAAEAYLDNAKLYFRIFNDNSAVSISGDYTLYDMNTEVPASLNGNQLNKGYYKVKANTGTVTVTYTNGYTDISYNFYNQLGRQVASIAPEGVKKLLGSGYTNYASIAEVPFISINEFDAQGRLVKSTSIDGGTTEIVYRADGRVRFAQNAEQKLSGRYSYTNYDQFGRAVESGEYQPDPGSGIAFNSDLSAAGNGMKNILEDLSATGGLINGAKKDVVMTLYDIPDNSHGLGTYVQSPQFLGGSVSVIKKYSSIVNNTPNSADLISSTWYNYDEEERMPWTIFYIKGLGYKTLDFTYDAQNRVVKKDYQKGTPGERFIHYYDYDPLTQKLWKVYTSTDDVAATKKLQATYIYYLHGPLKRIELGGDVQGIDYTYTLQGTLKAINNSNRTKDPGGDGNNAFAADAFGMVLDYFSGDYQNSRPSALIEPIKGVSANGVGADSYVGDIKAMTWFSKKPAAVTGSVPGIEDPTTYVYKYDNKYQFTESTWGAGIDFNNTPATFTTTGDYKETIRNLADGSAGYDANGNILHLQRTGAAGALIDNFTYNYLNAATGTGSVTNYNTNKLESVVKNGTGVPYASYTYNKSGQLIGESNTSEGTDKSKYIEYDATGKVTAVYRDAGKAHKVVEYVYDAMGDRIIKKSYNTAYQLSEITYYMGSVIYTQPVTNGTTLGNITVQEYDIQGATGRIGTFYRGQMPVYAYELSDHLGNVRAVVAKDASTFEVRAYTDYYPYGMVIRGGNGYRYGFQGQHAEKDEETGWNAFDLRMYDSKIARWLSIDPAGQFHSPYVSMGNNPVASSDPSGGFASWAGALLNQWWTGNRGEIYKTDGGTYGYNCENCGLQDGSGAFFIYKNGQYDRSKYNAMDEKRNAVNLEFIRKHDYAAAARNEPTIIPGFKNDGRIIVSDGNGGARAAWNEAIEYPAIDPVDGVAGLAGAMSKAFIRKGTLQLLGEWGGDDIVQEASKNLLKKRGWYDFVAHGSEDGMEIVFKNAWGMETGRIRPKQLYDLMLADGYKPGTPIRLLICNSGMHETKGVAFEISKLANAWVKAPNAPVGVMDGTQFFRKGIIKVVDCGKMVNFYKGKFGKP